MRYIFIFLLLILIFLSGCTLPYFPDDSGSHQIRPLSISLDSDLTNIISEDTTYLYLTFDNLDEKEEYDIDATIMNPGLFSVYITPRSEELAGFQRKTLKFKLRAPKVPTETQTRVSVETKISKTFEFYFPVLFVDTDYLREEEVLNRPIPKKPKTYSFSDTLVNVNIELNKNPPIDDREDAYANIKVSPLGNGILKLEGIEVDRRNCEINKHKNTGFCSFSGRAKDIEEEKFIIEIEYEYKETKSLSFVILPEFGEHVPPIEIPGVPPEIEELEPGEEIPLGSKKYFGLDFSQLSCGASKEIINCGGKEFELTFEEISKDIRCIDEKLYTFTELHEDSKDLKNPEKAETDRGVRLGVYHKDTHESVRIPDCIIKYYKITEYNPITGKNETRYERTKPKIPCVLIGDETVDITKEYMEKEDEIDDILHDELYDNYLYLEYIGMDLEDEISYYCVDDRGSYIGRDEVSVMYPIEDIREIEPEDYSICVGGHADESKSTIDLTGTKAYFIVQCMRWERKEICVSLNFEDLEIVEDETPGYLSCFKTISPEDVKEFKKGKTTKLEIEVCNEGGEDITEDFNVTFDVWADKDEDGEFEANIDKDYRIIEASDEELGFGECVFVSFDFTPKRCDYRHLINVVAKIDKIGEVPILCYDKSKQICIDISKQKRGEECSNRNECEEEDSWCREGKCVPEHGCWKYEHCMKGQYCGSDYMCYDY